MKKCWSEDHLTLNSPNTATEAPVSTLTLDQSAKNSAGNLDLNISWRYYSLGQSLNLSGQPASKTSYYRNIRERNILDLVKTFPIPVYYC